MSEEASQTGLAVSRPSPPGGSPPAGPAPWGFEAAQPADEHCVRAGCQGTPRLGAGRLGLGTAVRRLWQEPAPRRVSLRAVRLLTAVEGLRAGMGLSLLPRQPQI